MPIVVKELVGQRAGTQGGAVPYIVIGTNDKSAARAALDAQSPATFDGFSKVDVQVEEEYEQSATAGLWRGSVTYGNPDTRIFEVGESTFSFDTTGATQHITQSKQTRQIRKNGVGEAGNVGTGLFNNAIGVSRNGVQGVDVASRQFTFQETHLFADAQVTTEYLRNLYLLSGTVNAAVFKTKRFGDLQQGECLFFGAAGGSTQNGKMAITFHFAASPNVSTLTVGPVTLSAIPGTGNPGIAKFGWDYVWVKYRDDEDTTEKTLIVVPEFVAVERVYDPGKFGWLNINGNTPNA